MRGLKQPLIWAKKTLQRIGSRAIILLYHRVYDPKSDPQLLSVTPKHFAEHLECIRRYFYCMELSKLQAPLSKKGLKHKAVVITFDDGYRDNLFNAKPILDKFDIPATVFVSCGMIGSRAEFWWDELERVFLVPEELPRFLTLNIEGKAYKWDITVNDGAKEEEAHWNVLLDGPPNSRKGVYKALAQILKPLLDEKRGHLLEELRRWSNIGLQGRPDYLPLTANELISLARDGLIEIGSHGVTHSRLSSLDAEMQKDEITRSKKDLELILNKRISAFSYPFGGKTDYNDETVRILKACGYACACSNFPGWVLPKTDPFRLPRFIVRDWDGETFFRKLNGFFS